MNIEREEKGRKGTFFVAEGGEVLAKLEYFRSGPAQITIYHTEVSDKLRGQRVGNKLVAASVDYARENGLKIVPTCSFTKRVFERTPDYRDVLA